MRTCCSGQFPPCWRRDPEVSSWVWTNRSSTNGSILAARTLTQIRSCLLPAPAPLLMPTPVSQRVNSVKNDDPACLDPAETPIRLL
jgi:hypothetical protein